MINHKIVPLYPAQGELRTTHTQLFGEHFSVVVNTLGLKPGNPGSIPGSARFISRGRRRVWGLIVRSGPPLSPRDLDPFFFSSILLNFSFLSIQDHPTGQHRERHPECAVGNNKIGRVNSGSGHSNTAPVSSHDSQTSAEHYYPRGRISPG
jgi:hypothetical protein